VQQPRAVTVMALAGLDEVAPGDDLAAMVATAASGTDVLRGLRDADVVAIAHKVVSKAEGRIRVLSEVRAGEGATALAAELGKDARLVQVVLDESRKVLRAAHGVLICVTHHGFVCANAGVDASNVRGDDAVVLLPADPDASARGLRERFRALLGGAPAVVITDSFGRAWRHGQVDIAIGCAGIAPLDDWRGRTDAFGRKLSATWIAIADELAAAADLVRDKDGFAPVTVIRGLERRVSPEHGPGVAAMIRPESEDLFR
jgi:coenzyme F420-0:L-glutamate ligase/coenzyme F420-1:gamma-L-glutamate ligase